MTQLVVGDLEDDVRDKLQDLAKRHGRSVEEEVRDILREAVSVERAASPKLGSRLARCFAGQGLEEDISELRGHPTEPPTFEP